jgi:hypothetical protein
MSKTIKSVSITVIAFAAFLALGTYVNAALFAPIPSPSPSFMPLKTLISATTTSATSSNTVIIANAKRVNWYFTHGGVATSSTGTSTFKVQVSPDGSSWYDFGKLVQATSSNMQPTVQIVGATSTVEYGMNLDFDAFYAARAIVVEGTLSGASGDGEHSVAVTVQY